MLVIFVRDILKITELLGAVIVIFIHVYLLLQDISLMRDAVNRLDSTMSQKVGK